MGVAAAPRRGASMPQRSSTATKRRLRTDRDGDVSMDSGPAGAAAGRVRGGGISKRGRAGAVRDGTPTGPRRDLITNANTQQRIMRHAAEASLSRGPKPTFTRQTYKEAKVTGWENSKAASSNDRGISSLTGFLERKATQKKGSEVKIKKTHTSGNILFVYASEADINEIVKLNTFTFAGVPLTIEKTASRAGTPTTTDIHLEDASNKPTTEVKELLRSVLERRYNIEHKLLDLSALAQDEALKSLGIFQNTGPQSKFFPALMKVCDDLFQTAQAKQDAIQAIVLSNNALPDIKAVTTVGSTFPHLKNLDLSNNQFANLDALQPWRHKFRQLDHLIITGNPLEQNVPDFNLELMKWYPTLRLLNGIQVRTDAEVAASKTSRNKVPLPVQPAIFNDEAQIVESFIRTFFAGYDADRAALATMYYDESSKFSLNVNTGALRDPNASGQDKPVPHEWDAYIKKSRNFKKITHLPARLSRLIVGTKDITETWQSLPITKHLSVDTNPQNWLFECHPLPGVPDPSGQSQAGVNGFLVTVHGEFFEIDPKSGGQKHRSFDRTFILGPGGSTGVRVVSDVLAVRGYGGFAAFAPEPAPVPTTQIVPVQAISEEQQKEAMVVDLSHITRLQLQFSRQCLEESGWDKVLALANFERAKPNLPAEAFISL